MPVNIYANHGNLDDAYLKVKDYITELRSAQLILNNVDTALLSTWTGRGENAFYNLSKENHAVLKSLIEKTE